MSGFGFAYFPAATSNSSDDAPAPSFVSDLDYSSPAWKFITAKYPSMVLRGSPPDSGFGARVQSAFSQWMATAKPSAAVARANAMAVAANMTAWVVDSLPVGSPSAFQPMYVSLFALLLREAAKGAPAPQQRIDRVTQPQTMKASASSTWGAPAAQQTLRESSGSGSASSAVPVVLLGAVALGAGWVVYAKMTGRRVLPW